VIDLYERKYSRINPFISAGLFHERLAEMLGIVCESIQYLTQLTNQISMDIKILQGWSKEAIRFIVLTDPGIFHKDELCPCFSGKRYIGCCGKNALLRGYLR
jgi:hypothetical protein